MAVVRKEISNLLSKDKTPITPPEFESSESPPRNDFAAELVRRLNHRLQSLPSLLVEEKGISNDNVNKQKDEKDPATRIHDLKTKLQESYL